MLWIAALLAAAAQVLPLWPSVAKGQIPTTGPPTRAPHHVAVDMQGLKP